MDERRIQYRVVGHARKIGCLALKINIGAQKGWPDYLFVTPSGKHFWIEFKAPGKKPSVLQEYRIGLLTECGASVFICDNADVGEEIVNDMVSA